MNLSDPWRKLVDASKPILQKAVVSEAGLRNPVFGIVFIAGILGKFVLPLWVVHINPRYYKINIHISIVC
jgi:hypothetical protein